MGAYDPIDLVRILDDGDLLQRIEKDFQALRNAILQLQVYENKTGVPTNDTVIAGTDPTTGEWLASKLKGSIETLTNQINAGAGNVTITDHNGIMIVDNKDAPTKALRLLGGIFGIANSKDPVSGEWEWKSFGTGDGFTADLLTTGKILTSLINIVGNSGRLKIDGDSIHSYDENGVEKATFASFETLGDQLATFARASTAYKQDGSLVAAGVPRFESVGDRLGVMVEENSTNILGSDGNFEVDTDSDGVPDGWAFYANPAYQSIATDRKWAGSKAVKVSCDNTGGASQITPAGQSTLRDATAGLVYTQSCKVWIDGASLVGSPNVNMYIRFTDDAGAIINQETVRADITKVDQWQTISIAATAGVGTTKVRALLPYVNTPAGAKIICWYDAAKVEQKAYPTSYCDSTRAAEVITIPTAGVITGEKGTVEFKMFVPALSSKQGYVFDCQYGGDNYNRILVYGTMTSLRAVVGTGSTWVQTGLLPLQIGDNYIGLSWGSGGIKFRVNDQSATDATITRGPATVGTNMYLGSYSGGAYQALGALYNDLRCTSYDKTDAEMAAAYSSGLPLTVDDATTLLMSCDGHLQPTVRDYGLWSKNGRFVLQDPKAGQGIEVWQNDMLKVLIGLLSTGKIGMKVNDGEIYSSIVRTGAENSNTYVGIESPNKLVAYYNGQKVFETLANSSQGHLKFFEDGVQRGRIYAGGQSNPTFYILAEDESQARKRLYLQGINVEIHSSGDAEYHSATGGHYFYGDINMGSGTKNNIEETESYGKRKLAVRESPEQKYVDEGKAQLDNGICVVPICPIFLECIEPDSSSPWLIHLTAYGDNMGIFVAEIGSNYFIVKERNGGISSSPFVWALSATRKNYALTRFTEVV